MGWPPQILTELRQAELELADKLERERYGHLLDPLPRTVVESEACGDNAGGVDSCSSPLPKGKTAVPSADHVPALDLSTSGQSGMMTDADMPDISVAQAKRMCELADKVLRVTVMREHASGQNWSQIARELGVTPQAARQRWARFVPKAVDTKNNGAAESEHGPTVASSSPDGEHGDPPLGGGDIGDPVP